MPELILTREYMMLMRQALLMQLDAIEKLLGISPRTSELRKEARAIAYTEKQHEEIKV
jgi:predicted ATP-grasp superfamily ATP-dependent carboligase